MDDHLTIFSNTISKSQERVISIEDMLNTYPFLREINLEKGYSFNELTRNCKEIPSIRFATEKDAEEITKIFKEVYENTYPYKQMENVSKIQEMIRNPHFYWIIFSLEPDTVIGCIGIRLDFENKIGNLFGFAFKKRFQHLVDISTASIACVVAPMQKFKDQIFIWFAEIRSSFSSIQYIAKLTGFSPVGLLPNKDIFYYQPESEFLFVTYSKKILHDLRNGQKPRIISPAIFCYFHAFQKYNLGLPEIQNDNDLKLNKEKIKLNKKSLSRKIEKDEFGNELITISMKGTENYFQFFHYKAIQIAEKTKYKISSLEDLYSFLEEIKSIIRNYKLRYFEVFLTVYDYTHQTLFYKAGFKPTGYIPAFKYNKEKNMYEDQVLFVYHEKELNKNTELIPETEEFLKNIKYFKKIHEK